MVAYLLFLAGLKWFMGDERKGYELKTAMRLYNVVQIVLCAYMTAGLAACLWAAPALPPLVVGAWALPVPNVFGLSLPLAAAGEWFCFVHYLSKYLDFFDTAFIVLRRKDAQLSFLHMYHHASIGPVWGLLLYFGFGSGTALFGALVNSLVHVLMYTHYLVTSFGLRNPLKKALTLAQICQFYACIAHAVVVVATPLEREYIRGLAVLQVAYHASMIVLFSAFYTRSYTQRATTAAARQAKAAAGKHA